jgi:site-specific recombinase XerD
MPGRNAGQHPPNYGLELPAEVYTPAEMRALLRAFSRRGSAGIRNTAITALLYRCGVRVSEALKAPLGDLDMVEGTFYVRWPKRDLKGRRRPRLVAVDAETAALLERWLARRKQLAIKPSALLFCQVQHPCRGQALAASGYREALKAAGRKAGISKRMHPHGLRHTFAFMWLQEGRPLDQLQVLLGHRHLATTAHYAQHLNPKVALDAQRARSWETEAAAASTEVDEIVRQVLARIDSPHEMRAA